ncbi:NAD(P)-dependent alcohol dehydrogenase [Parvularcula flava]|uniref:Hydroxyacid dehydrogenase n=1 Tax=Aquisalinus luteolus TaxID=1566827 RepID=A0A8J3A919_9PROT|nr:NAD(P)-dependent alcohol dehydrogenase [Aquisalinus luteolus]NHK28785.1 NAD(P)-dependent alcohol dehydrogenase [Aquisalinus luteolus]GGH99510.1 hydroxyacid dehydrogenase [Aquisalinus luteolus]
MCNKCDDKHHIAGTAPADPARRNVMRQGAGLAIGAAGGSLLAGLGGAAGAAQSSTPRSSMAEETVEAFGFREAGAPARSMQIQRRAVQADDIKLDILYAGICHSDIHYINGDWNVSGVYPLVPGHEIIGRVTAVGANVTRFKVGDVAGVGCMVNSCGTCENCLADREQNCLNGTTFTYASEDRISGGLTDGGYSRKIVVREHFAVNVPQQLDLARAAPIMCAGITTFSPMQHWKLEQGQRVGVVGVGGLGHMAVKLAVARGADVTAFTTTPGKVPQIEAMGATPVLWDDQQAMQNLGNSFDLMISTVPYPFDIQQFMNLLKLDATLVNVGQLGQIDGLNGMMMGFGRKSLAGSMIGGMAETQEVVNYCAEHNVQPDVELIRPDQINEAISRVVDKDVKFRFVIDMQNA